MLFITRLMETSMTLEQYFHEINKQEKQPMSTFNLWDKEEPLTKVYFSITTPAVEHYPEHTHTLDIAWTDGARWHDVIWELAKVLEASYGYNIKDRVFYKVHELTIEAEETHGDPELAKQMFNKELS
jgi:hypothetical protein